MKHFSTGSGLLSLASTFDCRFFVLWGVVGTYSFPGNIRLQSFLKLTDFHLLSWLGLLMLAKQLSCLPTLVSYTRPAPPSSLEMCTFPLVLCTLQYDLGLCFLLGLENPICQFRMQVSRQSYYPSPFTMFATINTRLWGNTILLFLTLLIVVGLPCQEKF